MPLLFLFLFTIILEVLGSVIRHEIKYIKIRKRVKLILFSKEMSVYGRTFTQRNLKHKRFMANM